MQVVYIIAQVMHIWAIIVHTLGMVNGYPHTGAIIDSYPHTGAIIDSYPHGGARE